MYDYADSNGGETFCQDADYLREIKDKKIVNNIMKAAKNHSSDRYIIGTKDNNWQESRCDNYNEEVINEAGYTALKYMAGPAKSKNINEHISYALTNKLTEKTDRNDHPNIYGGAYVVYMSEGKWGNQAVDSHGGLLYFNDNKVYYSDNSSHNNKDPVSGVYAGGVQTRVYDSIDDFQADYGETYKSFYYLKIEE